MGRLLRKNINPLSSVIQRPKMVDLRLPDDNILSIKVRLEYPSLQTSHERENKDWDVFMFLKLFQSGNDSCRYSQGFTME